MQMQPPSPQQFPQPPPYDQEPRINLHEQGMQEVQHPAGLLSAYGLPPAYPFDEEQSALIKDGRLGELAARCTKMAEDADAASGQCGNPDLTQKLIEFSGHVTRLATFVQEAQQEQHIGLGEASVTARIDALLAPVQGSIMYARGVLEQECRLKDKIEGRPREVLDAKLAALDGLQAALGMAATPLPIEAALPDAAVRWPADDEKESEVAACDAAENTRLDPLQTQETLVRLRGARVSVGMLGAPAKLLGMHERVQALDASLMKLHGDVEAGGPAASAGSIRLCLDAIAQEVSRIDRDIRIADDPRGVLSECLKILRWLNGDLNDACRAAGLPMVFP